MLISDGFWRSHFAADPGVLGRTQHFSGLSLTIVGVMPKGMKFPVRGELWTPLVPVGEFEKREAREMQVAARLADDVSMGKARTELAGTLRLPDHVAARDGWIILRAECGEHGRPVLAFRVVIRE